MQQGYTPSYLPSFYNQQQSYTPQYSSNDQQIQTMWQYISIMRSEIETLKQQVAALQRK